MLFGTNTVNVSIKDIVPVGNSSVTIYGNGSNNMGAYQFKGYANRKYQVSVNGTILSEGIWEPVSDDDIAKDPVVRIKECAYRTYSEAAMNGPQDSSNLIIVERPAWTSFEVESDNQGMTWLPIGSNKVFK